MISVIVPTYNERDTIGRFVEKTSSEITRQKLDAEIIVVDNNSPDKTGEVLDAISGKYPLLRVIHRTKDLDLASAVMAGFLAAKGEVMGVMDADLSHPPEKISDMVTPIISGRADFTIGTRYTDGGGTVNWGLSRKIISAGATIMARGLTPAKDPMSGFFFIRKSVLKDVTMNPKGFKICLELLVMGNYSRIEEVPFVFVDREEGESKLGMGEVKYYLSTLRRLYWFKIRKCF